ncbi:MAG: hypothetical protein GW928_05345 [Rhodoferax sp.]|nr:hypothetical protein [Rhodoferax sp.]
MNLKRRIKRQLSYNVSRETIQEEGIEKEPDPICPYCQTELDVWPNGSGERFERMMMDDVDVNRILAELHAQRIYSCYRCNRRFKVNIETPWSMRDLGPTAARRASSDPAIPRPTQLQPQPYLDLSERNPFNAAEIRIRELTERMEADRRRRENRREAGPSLPSMSNSSPPHPSRNLNTGR